MNDTTRNVLAAALVVAAIVSADGDPSPPPPPGPAPGLSLAGAFAGPTASADAGLVAALSREIADEIEADGKSETPYMKAAAHFDTLRTRARDLRCRGRMLGDVHPEARDRIKAFLDAAVGTSGGPVDAKARAAWVDAYRQIGAAADAAR